MSSSEEQIVEATGTPSEIDEAALAAAHLAVEDVLIDLRDRRIFILGPGNGFVVKERDGALSDVMRLGTRDGLRIGIAAYLAALTTSDSGASPPASVPSPPEPAQHECQRCSSDEWTWCDYRGCSECRPEQSSPGQAG